MGSQCSGEVGPHLFMMDRASEKCEPLSTSKIRGVVLLMGTEEGGRGSVFTVIPAPDPLV